MLQISTVGDQMIEDYAEALSVATEAALEAGAMLRDEFHRPGGPHGSGGHCEADLWSERLIRERLTSAFPNWAYRGEEMGYRPGAASERHMWLVDPNDGTASYLRGFRGPAVSIALIRDDEPVLGVVYSYVAPDAGGDLFAWAEGCGPMRRQGLAVDPPDWSASLSPHHVVLVSQDADLNPDSNLQCVAPARYRAVPSIAYRLALVAAGEGEAAVCLSDPAPWDYAAGHALLRAQGGELIGEDGRPIGYSRRGSTFARFLFGGSRAIAKSLSVRPWESVLARRSPSTARPELPFPVRLEPGQAIGDDGLLSRARGVLLGQLCGDSLGSLVEFRSHSEIRSRYPGGPRRLEDGGTWGTIAGQPTDDSEMALALARMLVRRGRYDEQSAAQAYWYWHQSSPFDEGSTTKQALGAIKDERWAAKSASASANSRSQSNGSLMRISPLAIFGHSLPPDHLADLARADSLLTHPHPVCQEACAVFVVAVARAVSSGGSSQEVYHDTKRWAAAACREEAVLNELVNAASGPPSDYSRHEGWVLTAFRNAFYQLLHAPTLEEGIVASVAAGGDTDTNAAIAGALLGAVHGYSAIPGQWRKMIISCRPAPGFSTVRRPRPYPFWPVDVLELSEKLAAISPSAAS